MRRRLAIILWAALLSPGLAYAKASAVTPATHTVYPGQTLGMIAKRYNVTIDELCAANSITRRSRIKPGQVLVVPGAHAGSASKPTSPAKKAASTPINRAAGKPSASNVPARTSGAAVARAANQAPSKAPTWKKYARPARRAGYIVLKATGRTWQGYAILKGNRISPAAQKGIKRALYSWRTGAEVEIDPRLIRALVKVSDTFGGRPLRIVSGYRESSFAKDSKHKSGRACDLSVEGVPNDALRDYLLTLDQLGVGYYPNSSFVHVDVRPKSTQWVDRSAPGEQPDYEH
jgi:uncharacterized protein YcbK (DUF882 family)